MTYFSGLEKRMNDDNKHKIGSDKIIAIILTVIASIGYFSLFTNLIGFMKHFLLGVFGVFAYALFTAMYLISGMLLKGKKYHVQKCYAIAISAALISILAIFHMAFSGGANFSNYGAYLSDIYNMQVSVGGLLMGLFVFPLQKLLNIGAYILFVIVIIICSAYIYNKIADSKSLSKIDFHLFKKREKIDDNKKIEERVEEERNIPNQNQIRVELKDNEMIAPESVDVGINAEIKKEESSRDIARRKLGLDKTPEERNAMFRSNSNELDTFKQNYMSGGNAVFSSRNYSEHNIRNSNLSGTFGYSSVINDGKSERNRDSNLSKYDEYRKFMGFTIHNDTADSNKYNSESESKPEVNTYKPDASTQTNDEKLFGTPVIPEKKEESTSATNIQFTYDTAKEKEDFLDKLTATKNEEVKMEGVVDKTSEKASENNISEILSDNLPHARVDLSRSPLSKYEQKPIINGSESTSMNGQNNSYSKPSAESDVKKVRIKPYHYTKPTLDLLSAVSTDPNTYGGDVEETGRKIENVLEEFKIPAKIRGITRGPAVTRYELEMPVGISVSKIPALESDIKMRIATTKNIMIQAPIPGMSAFGIEVPNDHVAMVSLKELISSEAFKTNKSPCAFGLGKEINGVVDICAVNKMPHVLIAGSTGSGKSVCLNCLILSILYKSSPEDVKFILIDPKRVEFSIYQGLPHLVIPEIISEPRKADNALGWAIKEMEKRYVLLEQYRVRNIDEYNSMDDVKQRHLPKMPYIIIIMDEFADMMQSDCKDIENKVMKLAAKARAAGIHLVLATQRPSVDVLSGTAKNNFPARIAFFLTSQMDSRTILGCGGAENLLGKGDMLYVAPGSSEGAKRLQGCFVSDDEVKAVVDYVISHNEPDFDESIVNEINRTKEADSVNPDGTFASFDEPLESEEEMEAYAKNVLKDFISMGRASASYIQRTQRVGFNKASRIIAYLAKKKYIADGDGTAKSRAVYITKDEYIRLFGNTDFDNHD